MSTTICIIDDDLVSQFATRYSLEQASYPCSIIACDSVTETLTTFDQLLEEKAEVPDIVLLDLVMDGMNGWDFLERFSQIGQWPKDTDIYILSAFNNSKDRARAKEHPLIRGYFDKPITPNDVEEIFSSKVK